MWNISPAKTPHLHMYIHCISTCTHTVCMHSCTHTVRIHSCTHTCKHTHKSAHTGSANSIIYTTKQCTPTSLHTDAHYTSPPSSSPPHLPVEGPGNGAPNTGLAHSRRTNEAENLPMSASFQLTHSNELLKRRTTGTTITECITPFMR